MVRSARRDPGFMRVRVDGIVYLAAGRTHSVDTVRAAVSARRPESESTRPPAMIRPDCTARSAATSRSAGACRTKSPSRMAVDVLAGRTRGVSDPGRTGGRLSVRMTTSNTAGWAKGFITTTVAVSPRAVFASVMNQRELDDASHREAAVDGGWAAACTTVAAPTQPPKYSTSVAAPAWSTRRGRWVSSPGGTANEDRASTSFAPKVVSRTRTAAAP